MNGEAERHYPFDLIFAKIQETLTHQNGDIRKVSQEIIVSIYE